MTEFRIYLLPFRKVDIFLRLLSTFFISLSDINEYITIGAGRNVWGVKHLSDPENITPSYIRTYVFMYMSQVLVLVLAEENNMTGSCQKLRCINVGWNINTTRTVDDN